MHRKVFQSFPISRVYQAHIPTCPSGYWAFGFASKKYHPISDFNQQRWNARGIKTSYYTTNLHLGAFMPVVAANRVGTETVTPCKENGGQSSSLRFYGSSFITDDIGELVSAAGREEETVLTAAFDLDAIAENRLSWGFYRDRRPDCYANGPHETC